jgi:hypothetical protein
MAEYVNPPLETDPTAIGDEQVAEVQARIPDWEASTADLATILIYASAVMHADTREVMSAVFSSIFRWYGAQLAGIPPIDDASASVASTWAAIDAQGYTIEAGTTVGIRAAGDELVLFDVEADVTIAPGDTATAAGEVLLTAQDGGSAGSGLGGPGVLAEVVDSLTWVDTVTLVGATSGGEDAETDEEYLNRLATELQLQSPRPILPRDFAVLYQRLAGVDRALAIDLYKPADQPNPGDPEDTNRPRSVTIVGIDEDGEPVSPTIRAAAVTMLEAMREATFEVWAMDPTYTTVDVDFAATAYPEWDAAQVEADAITAVQDYLSPASWGQPRFTDDRQWMVDDEVRIGELYQVLNAVDGLWRVDTLTFGARAQAVLDDTADTATLNAHGLVDGDRVAFRDLGTATGPVVDTLYHVVGSTANTFQVSLAAGGAPVDITADGTATFARMAADDITLAGVAPLTRAGSVTGAVVAP